MHVYTKTVFVQYRIIFECVITSHVIQICAKTLAETRYRKYDTFSVGMPWGSAILRYYMK